MEPKDEDRRKFPRLHREPNEVDDVPPPTPRSSDDDDDEADDEVFLIDA